MFKKIISLALAVVMVLSMTVIFAGCSTSTANNGLKIGVVLIGDENEGYSFAHIDGIKKAAKACGINESSILWKYNIGESEACYDAIMDLANKGCNAIFANSYGHQSYMQQAAEEMKDSGISFISMTGDTAAPSGLDNLYNAFTKIFQSRYVSGVVAGMKIKELIDGGKLTDANYDADGNVKVGYVGAFPYAEVVSGYTAFFLGIRSIVPNVSMQVKYTNSWGSITDEAAVAEFFVSDGCVIIGQHADTTGAPSAVQALLEKGNVCYSVGYNIDMLSVAPDAALTSATNNWSVYYTYAFNQLLKGEALAKDYAAGYEADGVAITELGKSCAAGTKEKVAEVEAALKDGSLKVFDTSKWTTGGQTLSSYNTAFGFEGNELISDGYFHESELRSAPAFDIRIDGITELN